MAVRVRCPKCNKLCQVEPQHIGAKVRCGHCASIFVASQDSADAPSGGLLGGIKGMVRSFTTPYADVQANDATEPDLELELDGAPPSPAPLPSSPSTTGVLHLDIGGATSTGRVRSRNEDSHGTIHWTRSNLDQHHEVAAIVVADGMGGCEAGDRASALVVQEVLGGLSAELSKAGGAATAVPLGQTIGRLIAVANDVVLHQSQTDRSCQGMGSTAAVVAVRDGEAAIGHVGDCRVYHYTGGQLKQITQDQTLVARLVELGMLTPDEALTHPQRNEVTQAIGKHTEIQPTSQQIKLAIGDWLIVACDGLHAHVDLPALVAALASAPPSAVALAEHLVDMTNQGGGTDNCTVVALRCW